MIVRRRLPALVATLLILAPGAAHACAVCFDPRAESRAAFLATTAFLSFLPLGLIGSLFVWLRRRSRALQELPPEEHTPPAS